MASLADSQKFFAYFFQKRRSSFLKKRSKKLLSLQGAL